MAHPRVLLFDIDATLLKTGHAGLRALDRAFLRLYGIPAATEGIRPDGKTDPLIVREMLAEKARERDPEREIPRVIELYLAYLEEEVDTSPGFQVMPGVRDLLDALSKVPGVYLGLATGNLRQGAAIKLRRAGLDSYFRFGGFGSDSEDRTEVIRAAIRRARAFVQGEVPLEHVYVIGDTPRDIVHAKEVGVRTVAVATGKWSTEDLSGYGPDHLFEDLSCTERLLRVLVPE